MNYNYVQYLLTKHKTDLRINKTLKNGGFFTTITKHWLLLSRFQSGKKYIFLCVGEQFQRKCSHLPLTDVLCTTQPKS